MSLPAPHPTLGAQSKGKPGPIQTLPHADVTCDVRTIRKLYRGPWPRLPSLDLRCTQVLQNRLPGSSSRMSRCSRGGSPVPGAAAGVHLGS